MIFIFIHIHIILYKLIFENMLIEKYRKRNYMKGFLICTKGKFILVINEFVIFIIVLKIICR